MTQRLTLTDAAGNVLAQAEGDEPQLVHDLPAGDYVLQAEELDTELDTEPEGADQLAPDGTSWATYLGAAIARWLGADSTASGDPPLRRAFRNWDTAGRPER